MKYILMMNTPGGGAYQIDSWPQKDVKAHLAYWRALNADLQKTGELVAVEALASPQRARRVRAGADGRPITDGVFPETKEFLAGYWILDVANEARAHEIAARASAAPGPDGQPLNMVIEVREVMRLDLEDYPPR
jgi:hypothetical protein